MVKVAEFFGESDSSDPGDNRTSLTIRSKTAQRLYRFKKWGESWDDFFNRLLDSLEKGKEV